MFYDKQQTKGNNSARQTRDKQERPESPTVTPPDMRVTKMTKFQGVLYDKNSEGVPYGGRDGAVQPGETKWYYWSVPADFAPAEGDPDCINQAYYSAVDPVKDTNSGLIGKGHPPGQRHQVRAHR